MTAESIIAKNLLDLARWELGRDKAEAAVRQLRERIIGQCEVIGLLNWEALQLALKDPDHAISVALRESKQ